MTEDSLFWIAFAGLTVTAAAATGAKVLTDFSLSELEEYCQRRERLGLFGLILDEHDAVAKSCESLQILGSAVMLTAGALWIAQVSQTASQPAGQFAGYGQLFAAASLGVLLLLAFTMWIPWAVVKLWSAPFLFYTWPFWRAIGRVLSPLAVGTPFFAELMQRLTNRRKKEPDHEEAIEEEILSIAAAGEREGLLEADVRDMIEGVIELDDLDVADIMSSRSMIDAVDVDRTWTEILEVVLKSGRTRLPVYEKTLDNVIGVLYVKDLLPELVEGQGRPKKSVRELMRKAWFARKSRATDDLLRDFLHSRSHLAVVVDDYHSVCGVVTIEDVLEEIVGEILDESDNEEAEVEIKRCDEQTAEALGKARLDDLNQQLGLDLPEPDEYDTVAGLVINELGRIPLRGESVVAGNVRFTVLEASKRKIERLRIEKL